jgi:multicomponent Na+:H+ antiporter subunit E
MSRIRLGSAIFFVWLVVLWILLWGDVTLANLVGGVLAASVLLWLVPREQATSDTPILRPVAMASLAAWFVWALLDANVRVAIEALRPPSRSRIRPGVVAVPLPGCPAGIATAVANTITLTPGTLTLEVDDRVPTLYVHALQIDSAEAVRADVYDIERRIVAAVGSQTARDAVAQRSTDAGAAAAADPALAAAEPPSDAGVADAATAATPDPLPEEPA